MNIGDLAHFQPRIGILVPAKLHEQVYLDIHYGLYLQQLTIFICGISLYNCYLGRNRTTTNSFKLSMNRTFLPVDMPEHMPEDMPDRMPDRMPEDRYGFWHVLTHVVKRFVHRSPGLGCWRPTAQRPGCNSGAGRCLCQLGPKGSNPDHQPLESWQVHSTTLKVTGFFLPRKGSPVPMLSAPRSSELSKLVANAMLAQRVSSINSISRQSAVGKWKPMVHLGYRKSNHNPTKLAVQTCCV